MRRLQGNLRPLMVTKGENISILNRGTHHLSYPECQKKVAANPVACAKFFHLMVNAFLEKIVGLNSPLPGIFGPIESHFGTVEEQGRLTLHLHLLLWVKV